MKEKIANQSRNSSSPFSHNQYPTPPHAMRAQQRTTTTTNTINQTFEDPLPWLSTGGRIVSDIPILLIQSAFAISRFVLYNPFLLSPLHKIMIYSNSASRL